MPLWIGCAVWAFKGWVGDFYPPGTQSGQMLELYTKRLTTVEGNTTFYALPSEQTVERWAALMPPGFKFCPKLSKEITHKGELMGHLERTTVFLERMAGFGQRLGPVLVQLPPRYGPEHWPDLVQFLLKWPHDRVKMCVELRHLGWWEAAPRAALTQVLGELGASQVLLDTRPMYEPSDDPQELSERRKPQVPLALPAFTSPDLPLMVRYIGHPVAKENTGYLERWAIDVSQWLEDGVPVYFFCHCPQEEHSPGYARALHTLLQRHREVPPLPWEEVKARPTQMGLF